MAHLNKLLHHGSNSIIECPDLRHSRSDIDFGKAFYLTDNSRLASKWACRHKSNHNTQNAYDNTYWLDTTGLNIYCFDINQEWLDFVINNRNGAPFPKEYQQFDILVGAIADDSLFNTIDMYSEGLLTTEQAVKIINCMDYGDQIAVRTLKGLAGLTFCDARLLQGAEKQHYIDSQNMDNKIAAQKTAQLIKESQKVREWKN